MYKVQMHDSVTSKLLYGFAKDRGLIPRTDAQPVQLLINIPCTNIH